MTYWLPLLLLCSQTASAQEPQSGWTHWRQTIQEDAPLPIAVTQHWRLKVTMQGTEEPLERVLFNSEEEYGLLHLEDATLNLKIESRMASKARYRLLFDVTGTTGTVEGETSASLGICADGSVMHLWGNYLENPESEPIRFAGRATQEEFEGLYELFTEDVARIWADSANFPQDAAQAIINTYLPTQLSEFMHPTRSLLRATDWMQIKALRLHAEEVEAEFRLDSESGPIASILRWMDSPEGSSGTADGSQRRSACLRLIQSFRADFRFDANSGLAKSVYLQIMVPSGLIVSGAEGKVVVELSMRAEQAASSLPEEFEIGAPEEGYEWLDLTPHLEVWRGFLAPPEEIPLIIPTLPPPPEY